MNKISVVFSFNFIFLITVFFPCFSQSLAPGYPVFEENSRIRQISNNDLDSLNYSFLQNIGENVEFLSLMDSIDRNKINLFPVRISTILNTERPYWYSPNGMIPSNGLQVYFSGGIYFSRKYFSLEIQPEIIISENKKFLGFVGFEEQFLNRLFLVDLNRGDAPELFGNGIYKRISFGQSKIAGKIGSIEVGISTKNLWWGPGQWNALTFSNNAPGFLHGLIGTHRPAKVFFGDFEFQLISGFPKSKKFNSLQENIRSNDLKTYPNRSRYLNALTFSLQPKWIKGLHIGASRTVQTFTDSVNVNNFLDVLPVFWGITKESVGSDLVGESDKGRDQQITVFFRQVIPKAGIEFYGEFGRRDHALNLRDLTLSPAHSRAYILGFNKIISLKGEKYIQIRSEMTQQGQSVNWVVRANSTTPWGTNGTVGGFTNWDQPMGAGAGIGANIQMMEISLVKNIDKLGFYFERRAPFSDFYDTADLAKNGYDPWIDFTAGPIFDHRWGNLIFSGKLLFTYASNYYWSQGFGNQKEIDFSYRNNLFSTSSQFNIIYLFR